VRKIGLLFAILVAVLFSLAPFLWSLITSLKSGHEVFRIPPTVLPKDPTLANYVEIFEQRPFARYLANSILVGLGSTFLTLMAGALAAYSIARLHPRGGWLVEKGILFFALFPAGVLIAPLYSLAASLDLTESHLGLVVVHAALNLPFAVWMLTAFFRQFPSELEDAARVDGFSRLGTLFRIVLPISAPALAATAILVFIFSWNEFVIANTFLQLDELRTVPVGIAMISGATSREFPWGQISAAVVLTTLPIVAAVLAFQKWIVGGLTAGAVKG